MGQGTSQLNAACASGGQRHAPTAGLTYSVTLTVKSRRPAKSNECLTEDEEGCHRVPPQGVVHAWPRAGRQAAAACGRAPPP
jgi:hypothetical protein